MGSAYLAISVVTVLWATNFTVGKIGTEQIDPAFIASIRVVVTGLVFYSLLSPDERKLRPSDWKAILPLSLTGIATNHICFAWGIKNTTPSHSAIIHALVPVFVAVVAFFVIKERLGGRAVFGLVLAVAGALVVVVGGAENEAQKTLWGDVITTLGVTSFSIYTVYGRKALRSMGSFRAVALAFIVAVPFMLPVLVWGTVNQPSWQAVDWKGWAALAYMLVFANMVCYRLHIFALTKLTAGRVAAFTDLQPAIGIGVAVLAGRDQVTGSLLAGAAVALIGVVLVQFRR
jgi:drug/metabolite transporter (DMT)-like permease